MDEQGPVRAPDDERRAMNIAGGVLGRTRPRRSGTTVAVVSRVERSSAPHPANLGMELAHLARLHAELALAEVRRPLKTAAIAVAVIAISAMAGMGAVVVLIAGALAPLFGAPWQHLVIAGGGCVLIAVLAAASSVWRLRRLRLPRETLASLTENWSWLVAQVKSKLTLR